MAGHNCCSLRCSWPVQHPAEVLLRETSLLHAGELGSCHWEIGNYRKALLADCLGCTGTTGSACAHLHSLLSTDLETFNLYSVQMLSHFVQDKDVLLMHSQYNDFLVQLSFPFPFSLLYLVLFHSDICQLLQFLWASMNTPKWWLFGLGDPWVRHWKKQGETLLLSGQLLTIQSPTFCILLITGNSPSLLFLDIIEWDW